MGNSWKHFQQNFEHIWLRPIYSSRFTTTQSQIFTCLKNIEKMIGCLSLTHNIWIAHRHIHDHSPNFASILCFPSYGTTLQDTSLCITWDDCLYICWFSNCIHACSVVSVTKIIDLVCKGTGEIQASYIVHYTSLVCHITTTFCHYHN